MSIGGGGGGKSELYLHTKAGNFLFPSNLLPENLT